MHRGINLGSKQDFIAMNKLIVATDLRFHDVIDKTFSMEDAAAALEHVWSGNHIGKVVIKMS
jgi:NADPH:quinone reductase-like Zn-dependent oxidoreductase